MRRSFRWTWFIGCVLLLAGCASPYKDALKRVGDVGPRIADDIRPSNPGGEARKAAFLDLVAECQRLGNE